MMFRIEQYDNKGKYCSAIAIDHRAKVLDYCRTLLTKIEIEMMEMTPSELAMAQHANTICAALSTAFDSEGKLYVASNR